MHRFAINDAVVRLVTAYIQEEFLSCQLGPVATEAVTKPKRLINEHLTPLIATRTLAAEKYVRLRLPSGMWRIIFGLTLIFLVCRRDLFDLLLIQGLPSFLV